MTLQDYINLSQESINSFFSNLGPVVANIVAAAVILLVGLIVGSILKRVWDEILKAINLEKSLSGWSSYQRLAKSHDDLTITTLGGELLRWLAIVVFLLPAVAALGVSGSSEILSKLLNYLPNVVLASVFLVLGFVFSWFAHRLVMAVAVLVDKNQRNQTDAVSLLLDGSDPAVTGCRIELGNYCCRPYTICSPPRSSASAGTGMCGCDVPSM